MYISLNVSTTSSLTHLYGFQLLVLLPQFTEITFFVCINRINLMNLNESSGRLIVVAKGFLQLPNLHMLLKQLSLSLPRNLTLGIFFKLPIMFSPKVNLQYLLYSAARRCYPLHLRKQSCLLKTFLGTLILMTWLSLYLFSLLELI